MAERTEELDSYQRNIHKGLDRAFEDAGEIGVDIGSERLVVFSDHHKGARDGADDFLRCERAYNAALGYYLEAGYRLIVLGDVEELWECSPAEAVKAHRPTLELEAQFHSQGRYLRFWGNHDDQWRSEDEIEKHLAELFPGLEVHEALKLRLTRGGAEAGLMFLVHGHQGTLESERFAWFSRIVVRYVWRPLQRRLGMSSTTPAKDFELRQRHDRAMFTWSRANPENPVLVAGHTHRPVFWTSQPPQPKPPLAELERKLEELRSSPSPDAEEIARLRAQLELARAEERGGDPPPTPIDPPCYFNTGCCSFGDGDVTGIEIADGEMRLVRWPNDAGEALPKVLTKENVADVLEAVRR
jgi:UDP-2,3-diacylglucosamine pyrophosphatase LpxH